MQSGQDDPVVDVPAAIDDVRQVDRERQGSEQRCRKQDLAQRKAERGERVAGRLDDRGDEPLARAGDTGGAGGFYGCRRFQGRCTLVVGVDYGLGYCGVIGAIAIVIPCFDEAERLDLATLATTIDERPDWSFVFVDDGSTDGTTDLLDRLRAPHSDRVSVLRLERNAGKAEAVRRGMREAMAGGAELIAYSDADLSTPFEELARLIDRLSGDESLTAVLGSRFRRLGADIRRSELRHYLGRVYATLASLALRVGIYDTQCGAKAFRATPRLEQALADPFEERWAFDVELLSRLTRGRGADAWSSIVEEPLLAWHAVGGSKLGSGQAARAAAELVRIGRRHRRADSV